MVSASDKRTVQPHCGASLAPNSIAASSIQPFHLFAIKFSAKNGREGRHDEATDDHAVIVYLPPLSIRHARSNGPAGGRHRIRWL